MGHSASFAGVVLAAGESSRMGRDKALLPWPPASATAVPSADLAPRDTFLSAAIQSLSLSTDFIVVVVGNNEPSLTPVVYANGAFLAINPDPERGQFSSLQVGLREVLTRGRDAAMITLVDRPPASRDSVQLLREAFEAAPQSIWAVVPEHSGKHGHPFIAGRDLMELFLRAPATASARGLMHQNESRIQYVPVSDPAVAMNINTPEEYSALLAKSL